MSAKRRQPPPATAPVDEAFTAGVETGEAEAAVTRDAPANEGALPAAAGRAFVMSDDDEVPEEFRVRPPQGLPPLPGAPAQPPALPRPADPPAGSTVQYEHRIRVLEAFRYEGHFAGAPEWVDRGWLVFGDRDETRGLPPGPALAVPTPRAPGGSAVCRRGDYVVRQSVRVAPGLAEVDQLEVWEGPEFERLFIPVARPPSVYDAGFGARGELVLPPGMTPADPLEPGTYPDPVPREAGP